MILHVENMPDSRTYTLDSEIRSYYNNDFKIRLILFTLVDNIQ